MLLQQDIQFTYHTTGAIEPTAAPIATIQSTAAFKDDFSQNSLDDVSRYVRFGPQLCKVAKGVLRMEVNANQWHQMECLNILPCFGKTSQLSLKARWAGGEGASLFIGCDWRYRHSGAGCRGRTCRSPGRTHACCCD